MREKIYIISAKRLPCCRSRGEKIIPEDGGDGIKRHPGTYAALGSVELLSTVFNGLIDEHPNLINDIDDILTGCAIQESDQGANVARLAQLTTKIPIKTPAATINRLCGSSLTAAMKATEFLIAGSSFANDNPGLVMVGGIEHMGNHDMGQLFLSSKYFHDNFGKTNVCSLNMGLTAEKLADNYNISRIDQETFAYQSHMKAIKAQDNNKFDQEIIPIKLPDGTILKKDIGPRAYESLESALTLFSKLKPAFKNGGTVTAATSAPYTDGASGALIATESFVKEKKIKPLAEIIAWGSVGVDPNIMGIGPVDAVKKAIARAGIDFKQIGLIELNEAFCSQSIAVIKQLAINYKINEENLKQIINVNGGATALGHPLGATGTKLLATLTHEMLHRTDVEYGMVTMCIGMGQGDALIIKKV